MYTCRAPGSIAPDPDLAEVRQRTRGVRTLGESWRGAVGTRPDTVACHDVGVDGRSDVAWRRARRVADAVFIGVGGIVAVYLQFGHPGDWLVAALSVGVLALLVTCALVYRLSGVTFREMFRVRRFWKRSPQRPSLPVVASMDTARQLAEAGKRIQATKIVRQLTGVSLEQALAVVKEMERRQRSS